MPETDSSTLLQAPRLLPWHQALWKRVQDRRRLGSLPHALLLSGPSGLGKHDFAAYLAQALVCESRDQAAQPCGRCKACTLATAGTHPDITWLSPEEPGKQIRIDAVRSLVGRTTLTTQAQGSRVFIIEPADAMNRNAANALLKTLEEPGASSVLVLVSAAPHRLPATIRSRCQLLQFRPVSKTVAAQWLEQQSLSGPEGEPLGDGARQYDALLALAAGAPLTALSAAAEDWLGRSERLLAQLQELKSRQVNPIQVVSQWGALPVDALFVDLSRILTDLTRVATAGSGVDSGSGLFLPSLAGRLQSLANDINVQALFGFIDQLNLMRLQMVNNLNQQMLLEKIVIDWLSLTRKATLKGAGR